MSKTALVLVLGALVAGCSSSDDEDAPSNDAATLDVTRLLNGDSEATANSFWQCLSQVGLDEQSYVFSAYTDGTGVVSTVGPFDWVATEETVEVTAVGGQFFVISDIVFSEDSANVSYTQTSGPNNTAQTECVRQPL